MSIVNTRVMRWDWKEQPDMEQLARIVGELSGGRLHMHVPNTDCDEYALVVTDGPLSPRMVDAAWLTEFGHTPQEVAELLAERYGGET